MNADYSGEFQFPEHGPQGVTLPQVAHTLLYVFDYYVQLQKYDGLLERAAHFIPDQENAGSPRPRRGGPLGQIASRVSYPSLDDFGGKFTLKSLGSLFINQYSLCPGGIMANKALQIAHQSDRPSRKISLRVLKLISLPIWTIASLGIVRREQEISDLKNGVAEWNPQTRRHADLVQFVVDSSVSKSAWILDVGCGMGWLIRRLKEAGFLNMQGCDWGRRNFEDFNYHRTDLNQEGLRAYETASFDCVICSDVIEHLENPSSLLREISRVLRPNGVAFITLPNHSNFFERLAFLFTGNSTRFRTESPGEFGHISLLTFDIFSSLLKRAGLRLKEKRGGYAYCYGRFWGNLRSPAFSYNLMYLIEHET